MFIGLRHTFFLCFLILGTWGFTQELKPKDTPTAKVKRNKNENTSNAYKFPKDYKSIYKKNTKSILYGNSCALTVTRKMGFEYVVTSNKKISSKTRVGRILNNAWVKTYLVFTRSPFWKLILNKKLDECRDASGDRFG